MNTQRTCWLAYHTDLVHAPFQNLFSEVLLWNEGSQIKKDDVVFFGGGTDVDASFYGEERHTFAQLPDKFRDARERVVFSRAQAAGAGVVGICRGAQFLCVVSGGKLIQHVTGHTKYHSITTHDGRVISASSSHHQMMYPYNIPRWDLLAYSCGVGESFCEYGKTAQIKSGYKGKHKWTVEPEIIWIPDTRALCIQGHPEEPYVKHSSQFTQYCIQLLKSYLFRE